MVRITALVSFAALSLQAYSIELDTSNFDSIKAAASTLASGVVSYYTGNDTDGIPGIISDLGDPYWWWNGGALFDTLIQYWKFTADAQYNAITSEALQFQRGEDNDFLPVNWTNNISNDDSTIWALAAMSAAEANLPEVEGSPTWLSLAMNVFDIMTLRWEEETCNGGLRWQIFPYMSGYEYKTSMTAGAFFQLSARLARFTGNSTYAEWADKSFSWANSSNLIDDEWNVFDYSSVEDDCTTVSQAQSSYVAGSFISGAAHMYNVSDGDTKWKTVLDALLKRSIPLYFLDGIATEMSCESTEDCNTDMHAYKGIFAHQLIDTIQVAPYTKSVIMPSIKSSAEAAAKVCDTEGCPIVWAGSGNSFDTDMNTEMSALSFVQGLLVEQAAPPVTQVSTGNADSTTGPATGAGTDSAAAPSGTNSESPAPTSSGNAAASGFKNIGSGSLALLLSSVAWIVL